MNEDFAEHVVKRGSILGRWAPVGFYVLNAALWFWTGVTFKSWDLLWLVVLTIPAIALYLWQTRWSRISR